MNRKVIHHKQLIEAHVRSEILTQCAVHKFAASLLSLQRSPTKLSSTAYAFRHADDYQQLRVLATTPSATAKQWAQVRHYIGRLASWAKSARSIARMAGCAEFRPYLRTATARALKSLPAVARSPLLGSGGGGDGDYSEILTTALPHLPLAQARARFAAGLAHPTAREYAKNRLAECTAPAFQPRVHAEIPMLKHFAPGPSPARTGPKQERGSPPRRRGPRRPRRFAFDDRYIACSKPPCFACALYRDVCHAGVAMRPGHGNVWLAWSLPCEPGGGGADDPGRHDSRRPSRLLDATRNIDRMIEAMRVRVVKAFYAHPDVGGGGGGGAGVALDAGVVGAAAAAAGGAVAAGRRTIKFDSNTDIDTTLPRTASVRKCFVEGAAVAD